MFSFKQELEDMTKDNEQLIKNISTLDTPCLYYGLSSLGKNLELLHNYQPKIEKHSKRINFFIQPSGNS